jgi:hypothetical protein
MSYKVLSAGILTVIVAAVSVMAAEVYSVRRGQEIIANIASQKLQEESVKRLKNLGMRFVCYANDRNERYPDKIEQLKDFDVNDADIKWFNENVEYRGKGLSIIEPPYTVIAYDKNLAKIGEAAVLFNDSEVVIVGTEKLMSMLSAEPNSGAAAREAKPTDMWEDKKSENEKWNPLALGGIGGESVAFSKPFEEKGQTWMTVTHNIKSKDVCLVVIDDKGKEHAAARTIALAASAFTQLTVAFDVPFVNIVSFKLKPAPKPLPGRERKNCT